MIFLKYWILLRNKKQNGFWNRMKKRLFVRWLFPYSFIYLKMMPMHWHSKDHGCGPSVVDKNYIEHRCLLYHFPRNTSDIMIRKIKPFLILIPSKFQAILQEFWISLNTIWKGQWKRESEKGQYILTYAWITRIEHFCTFINGCHWSQSKTKSQYAWNNVQIISLVVISHKAHH